MTLSPCAHRFCTACLRRQLAADARRALPTRCALCRSPLLGCSPSMVRGGLRLRLRAPPDGATLRHKAFPDTPSPHPPLDDPPLDDPPLAPPRSATSTVLRVDAGSDAFLAGWRSGDVLLAINGVPCACSLPFVRASLSRDAVLDVQVSRPCAPLAALRRRADSLVHNKGGLRHLRQG